MVVAAAVQDRERPVHLFGYNKPYQLVGKYQSGKCPYRFGFCAQGFAYAKSTANEQHQGAGAGIAQPAKLRCPFFGGKGFAPFVQHY